MIVPDPAAAQPPGLQEMSEHLVQFSENLTEHSRQRFAEMLPRLASRLMGDEQAAREALEAGGFLLNETTIVLRLNEDMNQIEVFCDVGLPEAHTQEAVYRAALEHNLCRDYPGITFGVHPESGRLVATTALHMLLIADDEVCLNTVQMMSSVAREVREAHGLIVD